MNKNVRLIAGLLLLLPTIGIKAFADPVSPVSPVKAEAYVFQTDTEIGRTFKLQSGPIDTTTTFDDLRNLYFYRYLVGTGAEHLQGKSDDRLRIYGFTWADIKNDVESRKSALTEAIAQKRVGVAKGGVKVRVVDTKKWKFSYIGAGESIAKTPIEKWALSFNYDFGGSINAYKVEFLEGPLAGEQRWVTMYLGRDLESQSGEEAFKSVAGDGGLVLPPAAKIGDNPSPLEAASPAAGKASPSSSATQPFTYLGSFTVPYSKGADKGNALVIVNSLKTGTTKSLDLQYLHAENGRMVVFDNELLDGDAQTETFLTSIDATKTTVRKHADYSYRYEPSTAAALLTATSWRAYRPAGRTSTFSTPTTTREALPSYSSPRTSTGGSKGLPELKYNGPVSVRGYTRKDGTYVRPHTRSAPGTRSSGRKR